MKRLVLLVLAAGCGGDTALGQAVVQPDCDPSDAACLAAGFGAPLALGGRQKLVLDLDAAGASAPLGLRSADPDVVAVDGEDVIGTGEGVAALLITADKSTIVDFVHASVVEPTRLGLHREDDGLGDELTSPVELLPGDELVISAHAYRGSERLLGQAATEFSVDSAAVSLLRDGADDRRRLVARAPGSATVKVTSFGFEATLSIGVLP
jgi:hypothetical protein